MDEPRGIKFCREVKYQKIFDTSLGVFLNLDQGHDVALKTVFLKYDLNFGMNEPTDLMFCREVKHQKVFDMCPGFFENLDQGPDGALETVIFQVWPDFWK